MILAKDVKVGDIIQDKYGVFYRVADTPCPGEFILVIWDTVEKCWRYFPGTFLHMHGELVTGIIHPVLKYKKGDLLMYHEGGLLYRVDYAGTVKGGAQYILSRWHGGERQWKPCVRPYTEKECSNAILISRNDTQEHKAPPPKNSKNKSEEYKALMAAAKVIKEASARDRRLLALGDLKVPKRVHKPISVDLVGESYNPYRGIFLPWIK